jgi:hypothetical protein
MHYCPDCGRLGHDRGACAVDRTAPPRVVVRPRNQTEYRDRLFIGCWVEAAQDLSYRLTGVQYWTAGQLYRVTNLTIQEGFCFVTATTDLPDEVTYICLDYLVGPHATAKDISVPA